MPETRPKPPHRYTARLITHTAPYQLTQPVSVWAHSPEDAEATLRAKWTGPFTTNDAGGILLKARPWTWSDGRVLFAHTTQDPEQDRIAYTQDRRNRGAWSVKTYARDVRAGNTSIPVRVIVVRHKWEPWKP